MRRFSCTMLVLLLVATVALTGCAKPAAKSITIASKDFTEGYVLTSLVAGMLRNAGFTVDEKAGMKTLIIRTALTSKQIDAYVEFTGTAWTTHLKKTDVIRDPVALFDAVKQGRPDGQRHRLGVAHRLQRHVCPGDSQCRRGKVREQHLQPGCICCSESKGSAVCSRFRVLRAPRRLPGSHQFYEMSIPSNQVKIMGAGITLPGTGQQAGRRGDDLFHNGLLRKFNLQVLDDDKSFFPIYNPALCIQKDVLAKYPEIPTILAPLTEILTTDAITSLNYAVDVQGDSPEAVALRYLKDNDLIK